MQRTERAKEMCEISMNMAKAALDSQEPFSASANGSSFHEKENGIIGIDPLIH